MSAVGKDISLPYTDEEADALRGRLQSLDTTTLVETIARSLDVLHTYVVEPVERNLVLVLKHALVVLALREDASREAMMDGVERVFADYDAEDDHDAG